MKKMFFALMVVFAMLVLVGCGEKSEAKATGDPNVATTLPSNEPSSSSAVTVAPANEPATTIEPNEPTTVSEPTQPESADPYEVLVTSPEVCKEYGGYYVLRDGKNYATGGTLPYEQIEGSGIGTMSTGIVGRANLYREWGNRDMVSMGDVPVIIIGEGDTLISYRLTEAQLYAIDSEPVASLRITIHEDTYYIYPGRGDTMPEAYYVNAPKQFQFEDIDGNIYPISENMPTDLSFGKQGVMSFFIGTDYHEQDVVVDSWRYKFSWDNAEIKLSGTLDKNGYAVYDLSGVAPGLYRLGSGDYSSIVRIG